MSVILTWNGVVKDSHQFTHENDNSWIAGTSYTYVIMDSPLDYNGSSLRWGTGRGSLWGTVGGFSWSSSVSGESVGEAAGIYRDTAEYADALIAFGESSVDMIDKMRRMGKSGIIYGEAGEVLGRI